MMTVKFAGDLGCFLSDDGLSDLFENLFIGCRIAEQQSVFIFLWFSGTSAPELMINRRQPYQEYNKETRYKEDQRLCLLGLMNWLLLKLFSPNGYK